MKNANTKLRNKPTRLFRYTATLVFWNGRDKVTRPVTLAALSKLKEGMPVKMKKQWIIETLAALPGTGIELGDFFVNQQEAA